MHRSEFLKLLGSALAASGLGGGTLSHDSDTGETFYTTRVSPSKGDDPLEMEIRVPNSIDDPYWLEIVESLDDVNVLAIRSWIINLQMRARRMLYNGATEEEVREYADSYRYGPPRHDKTTTVKMERNTFTEEQLRVLKENGVEIE